MSVREGVFRSARDKIRDTLLSVQFKCFDTFS